MMSNAGLLCQRDGWQICNLIPTRVAILNSFGRGYEPRPSLCTIAFHHTDCKDPDIHVLDRWMLTIETHPTYIILAVGMWLAIQWLNHHIQKKKNKKRKKTQCVDGGCHRSHWLSLYWQKCQMLPLALGLWFLGFSMQHFLEVAIEDFSLGTAVPFSLSVCNGFWQWNCSCDLNSHKMNSWVVPSHQVA